MQRLARLSKLRPALSPLETAKHAARLRRGVSGASGGSTPEVIRLQRVRFVKPKRSLSRRLFPWVSIGLIFYIAGTFSIEIEEVEEEEEEVEEEEEEEEGEGYVLFFPLPFTERLNYPPRYPPGSPEKVVLDGIRRDKKFCNNLRIRVSKLVHAVYSHDDRLVTRLGKPTGWRSWINVHFPDRPPPQWSQRGIVITEESIGWAQKQPVDPRVIDMLHKLLWPAPAAHAIWTYTKTITAQTFRNLVGSPDPPPLSRNPQGVLVGQNPDEKRAQVPFPLRRQIPGGPTAGPPAADGSKDGGSGPLTPPEGRQYGAEVTSNNAKRDDVDAGKGAAAPLRKPINLVRVPESLMRDLFPTAWDQLMHNLRAIWKRKTQYPPPGCVKLEGIVNVETPRNIVFLSVVAFYNPKTDRFDGRSLSMSLRGAEPKL